MSDHPQPDHEPLPPELAQRVDQVCDRFEAAWQAGPPPRLEDYLGDPTEPERSALLRELIALDIEYRQRQGETPKSEDYQARFPLLDPAWLARALAARPLARFVPSPKAPLPSGAAEMEPPKATPTSFPDPDGTGPGEPPSESASTNRAAETERPRVAGYEILDELGRGAMGVVYLARQVGLKRIVALKMILSGEHAGSQELARFRIEAEAVARLRHPHIVHIYEVGEYNGRPFFSLEYVDGGTLARKLGGVPLLAHQAARLVETLARAMHAVHQCHIVHRDLKPANVLLTADGTPKISDFGLAKQLDKDTGQTRTQAIMGTPSYMAPEQAAGQAKQVGPAADVYALGAILYEALTGRPPFQAATVLETLELVRTQEPRPPSRLQPSVPLDLEAICLKCLAKDPRRRYADAAALAKDLHGFQAGEPISARSMWSWERALRWVRRRRAEAACLGVSLAVALCLPLIGWHYGWKVRVERDAAQQALQKAEANSKRAEDSYRLAREALEDFMARLRARFPKGLPEDMHKMMLEAELEFYRKYADQRDDEPQFKAKRAQMLFQLGLDTAELSSSKDAIPFYERGRDLWVQLVRDFPEEKQYQKGLADTLNNLGFSYDKTGRLEEAKQNYGDALAIYKKLTEKYRTNLQYVLALGRVQCNLGAVVSDSGELQAALSWYAQAVATLESVRAKQPEDATARQALRDSHWGRAAILTKLARHAEALKDWDRAIELDDGNRAPGCASSGPWRWLA
jgi:tetratricopeptide (TPR) repeat protein